jgi:hypothetical protein
MAELELTRTRDDRRLYEIAGVGTLRFEGFFSRRPTAEAGAAAWSFDRRGLWQTTIEASDTTGAVVGSFAPRSLRRGGSLRWGDRDFELRPAAFAVRQLAEDASSNAGGAWAVAATG